jgi:hypothetical protein
VQTFNVETCARKAYNQRPALCHIMRLRCHITLANNALKETHGRFPIPSWHRPIQTRQRPRSTECPLGG